MSSLKRTRQETADPSMLHPDDPIELTVKPANTEDGAPRIISLPGGSLIGDLKEAIFEAYVLLFSCLFRCFFPLCCSLFFLLGIPLYSYVCFLYLVSECLEKVSGLCSKGGCSKRMAFLSIPHWRQRDSRHPVLLPFTWLKEPKRNYHQLELSLDPSQSLQTQTCLHRQYLLYALSNLLLYCVFFVIN